MKRGFSSYVALICTLAATACASDTVRTPAGEQLVRYGTIEQIVPVELQGDHELGLGTVLGAAAGGVLGHQVGHGSGRDAATVLGAIGGAVVGNRVENRYADTRPGQQILVVLDDRARISVTQPLDRSLWIGDRVRVEGSGQAARVVRN
ncbi:MAG TPA: glycine zipper 2TM domain-containing protein [Burkholderiales bacterium]|nr:glycine zipper 2TM domain-containing protein [Burkholderiales bacterium]